jgi:uncharacterized iron-regulated membrane protein
MRTDIIRMYKDIHGWVGIISGLALFVAFYAGAITMFEEPLQRWASAPLRAEALTPLDRTAELIAKVVSAHPEAAKEYDIVLAPGPENPGRMRWPASDDDRHQPLYFHADLRADGSLAVTGEGASPVAQFIDVLHQQVGLPFDHEIAMPIMGAIALLYGIALVSGVIVLLPTFLHDLFALRFGKNIKRMWLDVHNVLGVFSLPFHLVMVLTAVVFAFHDQFYDAQELALAPKSALSQSQKVEPRAVDPSRVALSPERIAVALAEQAPGFTPTLLSYRNARNGLSLRVTGNDSRYVQRGATFGVALVDPYTGTIVSGDYLPGHQSGWFVAVTSFFALHFGNFGGAPVRWSYFLLGLTGAFIFYTGNLLWIESRRKRERGAGQVVQSRSVRVMSSVTVGVSLGCVAGISLTVAAAKWLPQSNDAYLWHSWLYYGVFVSSAAWAVMRGAGRSAIELLWLCAMTTALIPLSSLIGWVSGATWNHPDSTGLVDAVAVIATMSFGAMALATRTRLRDARVGVWFLSREARETGATSYRSLDQ